MKQKLIQKAQELRQHGFTTGEIADELNVSMDTARWLTLQKPTEVKSDGPTDFAINWKSIGGNAARLRYVASALSDMTLIHGEGEVVCGIAVSGIPFATMMADLLEDMTGLDTSLAIFHPQKHRHPVVPVGQQPPQHSPRLDDVGSEPALELGGGDCGGIQPAHLALRAAPLVASAPGHRALLPACRPRERTPVQEYRLPPAPLPRNRRCEDVPHQLRRAVRLHQLACRQRLCRRVVPRLTLLEACEETMAAAAIGGVGISHQLQSCLSRQALSRRPHLRSCFWSHYGVDSVVDNEHDRKKVEGK